MSTHDLQDLLSADPFVPFRLFTIDGGSVTISSPASVQANSRRIVVFAPGSTRPTHILFHESICRVELLAGVELLE